MEKPKKSILYQPLIELIPKRYNNEYQPQEKVLAIMFLDASRRELKGEMIPTYEEISQELSIPESTLRLWWKTRDDIIRSIKMFSAAIPTVIEYRLAIETLRCLNAIAREGYEDMLDRDRIATFNMLMNKWRLMSGLSTNNVAHVHQFAPIPPNQVKAIEEEKKKK